MTTARVAVFFTWVTISLLVGSVNAHEGHDDAASPVASIAGAGSPRIEAASDLFEIVGVVDKGAMTLFLDRYATNEPIANAKIDIEIGSAKGPAQVNSDGTYTFRHAALATPGQLPVTLAITAGGDGDLLTGELVIPDPNAANARAEASPFLKQLGLAAGALILIGAITVTWWLFRRHRLGKNVK
jgi:hypothetical protein